MLNQRQSIIKRLRRGWCTGLEALIRLRHPEAMRQDF